MDTTWTVRPETPADIDGIDTVIASAFPTRAEADLVQALRADPAWIPGLSWVALDGDQVVGHALLTRCHIDDEPALCLAPCAVLPSHQSRGLGSAMIRASLDAARAVGERCVVVLGHPDYYPRFGFERASGHRVRLSITVPDEALMVLSLTGGPSPVGLVRYAAPFGI